MYMYVSLYVVEANIQASTCWTVRCLVQSHLLCEVIGA